MDQMTVGVGLIVVGTGAGLWIAGSIGGWTGGAIILSIVAIIIGCSCIVDDYYN